MDISDTDMKIHKNLNDKRRVYGEYLTPVQIFKEFILPEIKDKLHKYI